MIDPDDFGGGGPRLITPRMEDDERREILADMIAAETRCRLRQLAKAAGSTPADPAAVIVELEAHAAHVMRQSGAADLLPVRISIVARPTPKQPGRVVITFSGPAFGD